MAAFFNFEFVRNVFVELAFVLTGDCHAWNRKAGNFKKALQGVAVA